MLYAKYLILFVHNCDEKASVFQTDSVVSAEDDHYCLFRFRPVLGSYIPHLFKKYMINSMTVLLADYQDWLSDMFYQVPVPLVFISHVCNIEEAPFLITGRIALM